MTDHPVGSQPPHGSSEVLSVGEPGTPTSDATSDAERDAAPGGWRGHRRGTAIGAGVLAVALLGGGAALAASKLGGGGAQPDEAVPASAVAYVSVDFDPPAAQKVDALRFARRFPSGNAKIGKDGDLRQALFSSLKDNGSLTGDWSRDVAPWLGDRAALAVLPAAQDGDDPAVVVVLAVKDGGKASAGLAKVSGGKATCVLQGSFEVCAQDAAVAKKAVADAQKQPLSMAKHYADDQILLGERGLAHAWADLAALQQAVPTSGATQSALDSADVSGRVAMALRFDGPHLELVGRTFGTKLPAAGGKVSMAQLPADSLVAVSAAGAGDSLREAFASAKKAAGGAQVDSELQALQQQTGLAIPDDVVKAVGDRVSVVVGGGAGGTPQVAARLSGDRGTLDKIVNAVGGLGGLTLGRANAGSDSVLASTQAYADQVAKGSGLASTKAFQDAVPDAGDAQAVVFVNVSQVLSRFGDQLDLSAQDRKDLEALSSLGLSVESKGGDASFRLRLATR